MQGKVAQKCVPKSAISCHFLSIVRNTFSRLDRDFVRRQGMRVVPRRHPKNSGLNHDFIIYHQNIIHVFFDNTRWIGALDRFRDFAAPAGALAPMAAIQRPAELLWQFEQVPLKSLPIVGAGVSVGLVTWGLETTAPNLGTPRHWECLGDGVTTSRGAAALKAVVESEMKGLELASNRQPLAARDCRHNPSHDNELSWGSRIRT